MNQADLLKIYGRLEAKGRHGASAFNLSKETNISQAKVRRYLGKFSKAFVKVGGTENYAINQFHPVLDPRKRLSRDLDQYKKGQVMAWSGLIILCSGVATFLSVISFNS